MKIFVAVPVYDGKLQVQTVKALLDEKTIATACGDELQVCFLPSCSVPASGRNQLVKLFLESECEKLFFLDADLTWELGSIVKVARAPVDIAAGCYRYKMEPECYPVSWLPDDLWTNEFGLLEVETLPTGFMAISREAFEKFQKAYPNRTYDHMGHQLFCYFQMVFKDGVMHSDDTYFCKEWRALGGKIYLDPEITLVHWDLNIPYPGHIGNWLKQRAGLPLTA